MAADEFIAHLAGATDVNASIWQKIARLFRDALRKMGIDTRMTNADIETMLRDSYKKLAEENGMVDIDEKDGQAMFSISSNADEAEHIISMQRLMALLFPY